MKEDRHVNRQVNDYFIMINVIENNLGGGGRADFMHEVRELPTETFMTKKDKTKKNPKKT